MKYLLSCLSVYIIQSSLYNYYYYYHISQHEEYRIAGRVGIKIKGIIEEVYHDCRPTSKHYWQPHYNKGK